ncbi:hypothetical protein E2C01_085804 [Portunus trituberculatus]|uniref:Uncharacterized protein n=1 Tax=Portunus trituberculatus TaxID=210409 RepID=A0A5B7J8J9_PORTR|nr:hypothetical protein [Portunus trituberculatus]
MVTPEQRGRNAVKRARAGYFCGTTGVYRVKHFLSVRSRWVSEKGKVNMVR